jgi:hypothetical protein
LGSIFAEMALYASDAVTMNPAKSDLSFLGRESIERTLEEVLLRAGSMTGSGRKRTGGFAQSKCRSGHPRLRGVAAGLDPKADVCKT